MASMGAASMSAPTPRCEGGLVSLRKGRQMNQIVAIRITRMDNGSWAVEVDKTFAPENGGGMETFRESAPSAHLALDTAKGMVTLSPAIRSKA